MGNCSTSSSPTADGGCVPVSRSADSEKLQNKTITMPYQNLKIEHVPYIVKILEDGEHKINYDIEKINNVCFKWGYNALNFKKPSYLIKVDCTRNSTTFSVYAHAFMLPNSINILSSVLSQKIIDTKFWKSKQNILTLSTKYSQIMIQPYINNIYNKSIEMNICPDHRSEYIRNMIKYELSLCKSFSHIIYSNVYIHLDSDIYFYILKLNTIVTFILNVIIYNLAEQEIEFTDGLQVMFYRFIWKYIKKINFVCTTHMINSYFFPYLNKNLLLHNYDKIFKFWIKIIYNNHTDYILLINIQQFEFTYNSLKCATLENFKELFVGLDTPIYLRDYVSKIQEINDTVYNSITMTNSSSCVVPKIKMAKININSKICESLNRNTLADGKYNIKINKCKNKRCGH